MNVFLKRIVKIIRFLPIILPVIFSVLFFEVLPPQFDAIIYTDNIVGEGTCNAYLSSEDVNFAYLYKGDAYFGSELKTLRLTDLRYNINEVNLNVYGIKEADILAFDISVFGYIVTHLNKEGVSHPFKRDKVNEAVISNEELIVHMAPEDPEVGASLSLSGFDFIPQWVWIAYFSFIILISMLISVSLSILADYHSGFIIPVLNAVSVLVALILGAFFCGSFPYVNYTDFLLNWLILYAVSLLINAISLPCIGSVVVSVFIVLWYTANYFVISFRGKPIMPSDLRAMSTALEVADGYRLVPSWQMILSYIVVALYCVTVILVYRRSRKKKRHVTIKSLLIPRLIKAGAATLIIVVAINSPAFKRLNSFQWDAKVLEGFHREGIVLTFINSAMSSRVKKPEGYSKEKVDSYLDEYTSRNAEKTKGTQPVNIIMVMNEAFSDLRTVGMDPRIDVMPFIDSLEENTVEGRLYTSVFGGGTCNTEFEALTGNALAFLGTGAYPYTENITDRMFSLAHYFRNMGYVTEAFHANSATNWNRNIVYPHLGFDIFYDIEDYPEFTEETSLHSHPADIADYLFMEDEKEELQGQKSFFFNVTMQNHSDYDHFEDVEEAEPVKEYGNDLATEARVYLSLIKASDDEVKQLVESYQDSDEPTMIIFFGDHQPGLKGNTQEGIYTSAELNLDYFKTKFFIWTNYETETEHDVQISANYLPWLILERGNFDLPPYIQMLKELHEKYPIISAQGVMDAEGNVYTGVAEVMDDPLIKKYQYIQYANMFDEIDPAWFEVSEAGE